MNRILLLFTISILLSGCAAQRDLDLAENLIHERPDSSLAILNEWQTTHKTISNAKRARYSLLMSMALDKNYIDIKSDSVISPAVKYYSKRPGEKRMLSFYYQGLVLKNMESYSAAIIALEKAEIDANALSDSFYLGLINRNKAELFNLSGNDPAAIRCAQESVNHFSKAKADIYEHYAILALAIALTNNKEYNEALAVLDKLSPDSTDLYLNSQVQLIRAHAFWGVGASAEKVVLLYREVPKDFYDALDYGRLAESFERLGQRDSADYWLKVGYDLAPTQNYKATLDYRKAQLEKLRGHYKTAFDLLDYASAYQDSLTRVRLAESVSAAQRDYFKQERDLQIAKAHTATTRLYLWIALSIFVLVLMILLFVLQMNKKEARIREGLASLNSIESTVTKLISDNAFLVGGLVNERLKDLEAFSTEYCLADSDTEKEAIAKQYKIALEKLRNNPAVFSEIEDLLNQYCDNLMTKFREQFPEIKGDKLKMAIMFFTRLPYKKVELFFKHYTADTLKKAKNRLRDSILESSAPDKDLFLDSLEMKKGGRRAKQYV
jgi:tetratricopeptide (TPR) repeat protein